jgi:hypothetical protein
MTEQQAGYLEHTFTQAQKTTLVWLAQGRHVPDILIELGIGIWEYIAMIAIVREVYGVPKYLSDIALISEAWIHEDLGLSDGVIVWNNLR